MNMHRVAVLITVLSLIISCSSEKPSDITKQKPSGTGDGGVSETAQTNVSSPAGPYSLEIIPKDASRNSTLSLVSRGFSLSDAKIEWSVNGNTAASQEPNQFKATETRKGDKVQAKAIINGKEIISNDIQIKNSPPEVSSVRIIPEVSQSGETLSVEAAGGDIDGDDVVLTYEWTKNGEHASDSKRLGVPVKRGDKILVKVIPFDGELYGQPVILLREISNLSPRIVEDKIFNYSFDGKVYTYQVKASDPDGDPLTYSLKSSPQGMTINHSGLVQWNVPAGFKGKAPFTVSVSDGYGGEAQQSFAFEIRTETRK